MERKNVFPGLQRSQGRKHSSVSNSAVRSVEPCDSSTALSQWVQAWISIHKKEKARKGCEQCKHFDGYYEGNPTCELVDRVVHCCVLKKEVIK